MSNAAPTYRAFTVIKREGQDDFWLPIGAAFAHSTGEGLNLILQALPIAGADGVCKVVLRPPKDDQPQSSSEHAESRREGNRNDKTSARRR